MELKEQLDAFFLAISTLPRDELAAYLSVLIGLVLVIVAFLIW